MWPFTSLGAGIGSEIAGAFNAAMLGIWNAAISMLAGSFELVDHLSRFTLSTTSGPVHTLWPLTLWISGVLALALFFWQLIMTSLRAGRGFLRLLTGPVQYGIALALTVGLAAGLLTGVDGLTTGILTAGLHTQTFSDSLTHLGLGQQVHSGVSTVVLAVCAMLMIFPAAVGFMLEMVFREGAIYTLVVCIPISAAGLLAVGTQVWFWKVCRWLIALIMIKPAIALTVVLGVVLVANASGLDGVLAGAGVLLTSLIAPFLLFKLLAFIDPGTGAGMSARSFLSGRGGDSYLTSIPLRTLTNAAKHAGPGGNNTTQNAHIQRLEQAVRDRQTVSPTPTPEPHIGLPDPAHQQYLEAQRPSQPPASSPEPQQPGQATPDPAAPRHAPASVGADSTTTAEPPAEPADHTPEEP